MRNHLGMVYARSGKKAKAEGLFRQALEIDPQCLPSLSQLGMLYINQNRFADGEALLQRCLQINPTDATALLQLGMLQVKQKRWTDAEATFGRAIAGNQGNLPCRTQLGMLYAEQGRYADAIGQFEAVLAIDGKNIYAMHQLGMAYAKTGIPAQAEALFLCCIAQDKRQAQAYHQLGMLYAEQDRPSQAQAMFEKCLALQENNLPVLQTGDASTIFKGGAVSVAGTVKTTTVATDAYDSISFAGTNDALEGKTAIIDGKVYEFAKADKLGSVGKGNTAVVLGATKEETMKNLVAQLKSDGVTSASIYNSGSDTVVKIGNKDEIKVSNAQAVSASTKSQGITLGNDREVNGEFTMAMAATSAAATAAAKLANRQMIADAINGDSVLKELFTASAAASGAFSHGLLRQRKKTALCAPRGDTSLPIFARVSLNRYILPK